MPKRIKYPYTIPGKPYKFVGMDNKFMQTAMNIAEEDAYKTGYEPKSPVGVVFVKDGRILIGAADGSPYHSDFGCERKKLNIPSGERYDLCPGCDYPTHAEPKAINKAKKFKIDLKGSDAYLFGEWWCCKPCSDAMVKAGIKDIFLLKDSEEYFNRSLQTCKNGDFLFFKKLINE